MGAVYLGFQSGAAGFRRPVAIKRAHAHLLENPEFRRMLIAESRLASLVRHPNVVSVCDVDDVDGELLLIMDYVEGASLSELMTSGTPLPPSIALRIILDSCQGLHALHSACDSRGKRLGLVHRDVSPQNILVGIDGVARIADFGIAKACESTGNATGSLRGKPGYMAPEYITTGHATAAGDVFALGVVAWEALSRRRLFKVSSDMETLDRVRNLTIPPPSAFEPGLPPEVEAVVLRALARSPGERFASACDFGIALEGVVAASAFVTRHAAVGEHVQSIAQEKLTARRNALTEETPPHGAQIQNDELPGPAEILSAEILAGVSTPTPMRWVGTEPEAPPKHNRLMAVAGFVAASLAISGVGLIVAATQGKAEHEERAIARAAAASSARSERVPGPVRDEGVSAPALKLAPPPEPSPPAPTVTSSPRATAAPAPLPLPTFTTFVSPPSIPTVAPSTPPVSVAPPVSKPPSSNAASQGTVSIVSAPPARAPENPYK